MSTVSANVQAFFEAYQQASQPPALDQLAAFYDEVFLLAGPCGVRPIRREDALEALPEQAEHHRALGLVTSRIVSLAETRLADNYLMVRANWEMRIAQDVDQPVLIWVVKDYLLYQHQTALRIEMQLDHQAWATKL